MPLMHFIFTQIILLNELQTSIFSNSKTWCWLLGKATRRPNSHKVSVVLELVIPLTLWHIQLFSHWGRVIKTVMKDATHQDYAGRGKQAPPAPALSEFSVITHDSASISQHETLKPSNRAYSIILVHFYFFLFLFFKFLVFSSHS